MNMRGMVAGTVALCLLLLLLAPAGCVSRESLVRDMRVSRARAYSDWRYSSQPEQSQALVSGELPLRDALVLALANNKSLRAAKQAREASRGRLWTSYSAALPKVEVSASYTRLDSVPSFTVGGTAVALGSKDNYQFTATVEQPLFRGGSIPAAIRAARVFDLLSYEEVRGSVQEVVFTVAQAYFEILLAQHLVAVSDDAVTSAQAHLEDVKRKRTHGAASDFDVLRAETELALFRAEQIRRKNRVHIANTALLKAMGVSQESKVALADRLLFRRMDPALVKAVQIAYENRPDLAQAELDVRLREEAVRDARSKFLPNLDANYTRILARPNPTSTNDNNWGDDWNAGLVASFTIFDGFQREGEMIEARAEHKRARLRLVDAEEQAVFEIQRAILNIQDAEEAVESQQMNLRRAKEGLRLAKVGYREGVNTEIEVIDARAAYTDAQSLYYEAVHRHVTAKLDLQRAMGVLGPPLGSAADTLGEVEPTAIEAFPSGPVEEPPGVGTPATAAPAKNP